MAGPFVLTIDQGTTSSRALVIDRAGEVRGSGQHAFAQHYPQPGWVEHDASEIWSSTLDAIRDALAAAGIGPAELSAVGITNQRETVVMWDRATGEPVHRAIVWQDRRTAAICDEFRESGHEAAIRKATGLTLDPYFSATKLTWLLRERPDLRARAESGELAAGTVDAWLLWKLTGGQQFATDFTNASRTLLFNIRRGRWDDDLLGIFGVPRALLPTALPSSSPFGRTSDDVLGASVPVTGIAGDQQAALFGQACFAPGQAKNTYGTGCFLLSGTGRTPVASQQGLLTSIGPLAGATGPDYVVEGSVFVAGAAVQWLRDELGVVQASEDIEALAASVPDTGGVAFVPGFTGLGAPYWDPHARGAILGLTRGTSKAHIARAALEAIALSSAELLDAMNSDLPQPITDLRVDGGASRNDLLMQLQADLAAVTVTRTKNIETTAMGAAYLAGIGAGVWSGREEVASLWKVERVFEPSIDWDERAERLAAWRRAVDRTRGWVE